MQITDFIICEDIRFEESGKRSLMGVIEDTMIIFEQNINHTWPKPLSFGLMLRVLLSKEQLATKPSDFELLLQIDDERKTFAKGELPPFPMDSPEKNRLAIAMLVKNYPINKPGRIFAILRLKNKEGQVVAEQKTVDGVRLQVQVLEPTPENS